MAQVLGRSIAAPLTYAPAILQAIPRAEGRDGLGWDDATTIYGSDVWHLYELSWLNANDMPVSFTGTLTIPCQSRATVESKSLKLYLNSLNFHVFECSEDAAKCIIDDLSALVGMPVALRFIKPTDLNQITREPTGFDVDDFPAHGKLAAADRQTLLKTESIIDAEKLISHHLRSLCPVTGQPDWATLVLEYQGQKLDRPSLSAYINSFRQHQEYHEQCVERIYTDLLAVTAAEQLTVVAYYQRRGGIDITPWRSRQPIAAPPDRMARQ